MNKARDRIVQLADAGSFRELDGGGSPFRTIGPFDPSRSDGQGIVAGLALVVGRPVGFYAHDPDVQGGSVGLGEAQKICALLDACAARGCPAVGLIHSGGARIQEGVDGLAGYGEIFQRNVHYSGEIPQISIVFGPCAGGAVYSPALTDFIVMIEETGEMFITGPQVIRESTGEQTDRKSLGGAAVHLSKSGVGHFGVSSLDEAGRLLRKLISYLPLNRTDSPPLGSDRDDTNRLIPELDEWMTEDRRRAFDIHQVVTAVVDRDTFLEVQKNFASNIVAGFARFGGYPAGVVANNSASLAGALDIPSSEKAARFVRLCNGYGLPLVTFVDVPGYWPGVEQEHRGIIRHGAKLLFAYAEATVPRLTVIVRKAYGGAYDVMASKHLGADYNAAWPSAEIAVMGARGAVEILYKQELASSMNREENRRKKIGEYTEEFMNPRLALSRGYLDEIIQPSETRQKLCAKMKELMTRGFLRGSRTGNIPL